MFYLSNRGCNKLFSIYINVAFYNAVCSFIIILYLQILCIVSHLVTYKLIKKISHTFILLLIYLPVVSTSLSGMIEP